MYIVFYLNNNFIKHCSLEKLHSIKLQVFWYNINVICENVAATVSRMCDLNTK
jgi:hypothetical protein